MHYYTKMLVKTLFSKKTGKNSLENFVGGIIEFDRNFDEQQYITYHRACYDYYYNVVKPLTILKSNLSTKKMIDMLQYSSSKTWLEYQPLWMEIMIYRLKVLF